MINEGGNEGWERFRKRQGKTLKKILNKMRKQEKNKALQFKKFGNKVVAKDAVRARESFGEGIGAAYMPQAGKKGVPEREITSKAVKKQLNRNRNRSVMKGDLETPHVRYVHSRDKSTDYIRPERKKRRFKKKVKEAYPAGYESDMNKMADKEKNTWWKVQDKAKVAADKKKKELQKESKPGFYDKDGKKVNDMDAYFKKRDAERDARRKKVAAFAKAKGYSWQDRMKHVLQKNKNVKNVGVNESASGAAAIGLAKMVGGAAAKYAATKAAPYAAGAAAAYGAGKIAQHKLKKRRDQKMINKAADQAVAKYKASQEVNKEGTYDNYSKMRTDFVKRRGEQLTPKEKERANAMHKQRARDDIKRKMAKAYGIRPESFGDRGMSLQELGDPSKMNQLFRMGLAKKGELNLMKRMVKRGPDALKDPKLRTKMYELLVDLTDLITKDGQTFVKVRQNVQRNRKELQDVEELLYYGGKTILEVNTAYKLINIPEDMSGMSVSSGHKRSVKQGAGMTKKGVAAYRRRNPGSKLQTAVTTPPSKLKKGSKAAKRRKAFCSRSRSWTGERGKAARRRWNC